MSLQLNESVYRKNKNWIIESELESGFVEKLKKCVNSNLNILYENTYSSAVQGKNSTQYWIYDHQEHPKFFNEEFKSLILDIKSNVKTTLSKYDFINLTKFDLESIWTIVGGENSYCMIHDHTNISGISIVLYLQVPSIDPDDYFDKSRGQIYFVLDSDSLDDFKSRVVNITPTCGKILIFPNWLLHGTYPQMKGPRQTLNINLFT